MKISLQYVNDMDGHLQAVQLPIAEWNKILEQLKKQEQALKLKSDLKEAFEQVEILQSLKGKKQTLNEFLNEL
jgi:hypothetical protein